MSRWLCRQLQPVEHLLRHADALERMVVVAPFPDVVEKQRQDEQFRRRETQREPSGIAARSARRCRRSRSRFRMVSSVCSSTVYL